LQITKSIRKSIASFVELTLPYIIASSPIDGEGWRPLGNSNVFLQDAIFGHQWF